MESGSTFVFWYAPDDLHFDGCRCVCDSFFCAASFTITQPPD
jgi:hypothetical protein